MTGNDNDTAPNCEPGAALDMSDWAWEFLRRNPTYRSDWRASIPPRLLIVTLRDGTSLRRLRRRYPRAERWGLFAFTDPARATPAAPVFWLPDSHGHLIRARGSRAKSSGVGAAAPLATFADDLGRHTECLKTLKRFTRPNATGAPGSILGSDGRLSHALIALDENLAGKTYRQIAISLFDEQCVAEDWRGVSQFLKDRTRRLVAKGHELMNGGYRDLLA